MCDGALWSAMMSTNLHTVGVQRQAYTWILSSGHKFVWSIPHVNILMNNFLSGPWRLQETVRIARTWILSHCKTDVGNLSNEFDKSRRHFFNPPDWIIISFNAWASFGLSHSVYGSIFQPFLSQGTFFRWQRSQGTPPWNSVNNIQLLLSKCLE